MNKKTKNIIITGIIITLIGALIFVIAFSISGFNLSNIATTKFEKVTYEFDEVIKDISITTDTSKIKFIKTDDNKCKVICFESDLIKHNVQKENDKLVITSSDNRQWYDYIGLNVNTPSINIYLPNNEYNNINITTVTGDINIPNDFNFKNMNINGSTSNINSSANVKSKLDIITTTGSINIKSFESEDINITCKTGDINLHNIRCNNINIKGTTAEIELNNVIANDNIIINNTTGEVELNRCDARDISIETSTGDVECVLLSGKVFNVRSTTGEIDIPYSSEGGNCDITTSTGDISIIVK